MQMATANVCFQYETVLFCIVLRWVLLRWWWFYGKNTLQRTQVDWFIKCRTWTTAAAAGNDVDAEKGYP